jgi:outer membrane biosynthesis protein TonB
VRRASASWSIAIKKNNISMYYHSWNPDTSHWCAQENTRCPSANEIRKTSEYPISKEKEKKRKKKKKKKKKKPSNTHARPRAEKTKQKKSIFSNRHNTHRCAGCSTATERQSIPIGYVLLFTEQQVRPNQSTFPSGARRSVANS